MGTEADAIQSRVQAGILIIMFGVSFHEYLLSAPPRHPFRAINVYYRAINVHERPLTSINALLASINVH